MDIQNVLRILKNGAEKPKDDLNNYTKGNCDGQVQAYSHAWTLVKNLSLSSVVEQSKELTNNQCTLCGRTQEQLLKYKCTSSACPH